jgi:hypothetical protein
MRSKPGRIKHKETRAMKNTDLVAELLAMREVGIDVPDAAIERARTEDLSQYEAISVSELASLMIELEGGK